MKPRLIITTSLVFILGLLVVKPAQATTFSLSGPSSAQVGESININLTINPDNQRVIATDAVLHFDPDIFSIEDVSFSSTFPENINTNNDGLLKLTSFFTNSSQGLENSATFATIRVKTLRTAAVSLGLYCQQGSTTDSNILIAGQSSDTLNCSQLQNLAINITQSSGDSSTSSPSPSPSPSSSPESYTLPSPSADSYITSTNNDSSDNSRGGVNTNSTSTNSRTTNSTDPVELNTTVEATPQKSNPIARLFGLGSNNTTDNTTTSGQSQTGNNTGSQQRSAWFIPMIVLLIGSALGLVGIAVFAFWKYRQE